MNTARHVRSLEGTVTLENFDRIREIIVDECNDVIGLSLHFEVSPEDDTTNPRIVVSEDANRLVVYRTPDTEAEFVINGEIRWEHGAWIADGFYLVKPGGLHQGVASFGLIAIDEAALRLNLAVRIVRVNVNRLD